MDAPEYFLIPSDSATRERARRFMMLGVIALGVAGIFAGLLANTKSDYFYTALVVHVDLSVLVWFLTISCMFFTLATGGRGVGLLADAAFLSFTGGTLLIALSAFTGGTPYMSNYIPVIHHPVFFLGLGLMLCGVLVAVINLIIACAVRQSVQHFGVVSAAFIIIMAVVCFVWSAKTLPSALQGQVYYEYAFWGGGHVLQFVHTQLLLVSWLWLASASGLRLLLNKKILFALYGFGLLAALFGVYIDYTTTAISDENRNGFTLLMKHANGFAPLVLALFIIHAFIASRQPGNALARICLIMSMLLFFAGGSLGYLIAGSNLIVPAHYHGSIIGITIAFMGVCYLLLPHFGFADVALSLLARAQPVIYGGGMLCWMLGMALLGESGASRKTPGSADMLGNVVAGLKHSSDGLALIGGLLFVFVVLRAVYKKKESHGGL